MKQLEKFILAASILSILVLITGYFGIFYMTEWADRLGSRSFQFLFSLLPNIVFAIWLGWAATKNKLSKLPWVLLALAYGIYGVGLFYILLIYFNLLHLKSRFKTNET